MSIPLHEPELRKLIRNFLREDMGSGDITTEAIVPVRVRALGEFIAKQECIVAGLDLSYMVFRLLDPSVRWKSFYRDGQRVASGRVISRIEGHARALLTGERVALNLLQHLSGIATTANEYVRAIRGTRAKILDTRKTTPGWRALEKYAVRCGGGHNHRSGLYDAILIKDNHLALAGSVKEAMLLARKHNPQKLSLEVEVSSPDQLREALDLRAGHILLDNMTPHKVRRCVAMIRGRPGGKRIIVECSGGVSLKTVRAFARTGVDWISIGALTHSSPAVDISFDIGKM
jgi:nicotinate-nucleotide pyrophosphorylase (carboxylating)